MVSTSVLAFRILISRKGAKIFKMAAQPLNVAIANAWLSYLSEDCHLNNLCAFA
jgi:hypothetical protein